MEYSIIIPVYNSEQSLLDLFNRLSIVLEKITADFEIIFIDDCSQDKSWKVLTELHEKDSRVKIIQLMRNFGQHNAILCGFHMACGKYLITMDDDLQNPPEEIPKLIKHITENKLDLVYGEYESKKHPLFRNIGSYCIQVVYKMVFNFRHSPTSFRIINKELAEAVLKYDENYVYLDGLFAWSTQKIGFTYVVHKGREHGESGYTVGRLITLSLNMLTNFSIAPLQAASILGVFFAVIGIVMALFFLVKKVCCNITVTGYASLIIAVTLFSGIQLLTLGLLGEYIGRIHLNNNKKPQFLVRHKLD